jgi:hypothetical protein
MNLISIPAKRRWVAGVFFVLVLTLLLTPGYWSSPLTTARSVTFQTIVAFTLIRFGVLATVASLYAVFMIETFPLTSNWSAWYAPAALLAIATLVILALYGLVTTLKRRPLWPKILDAS